MTKFGDNWSPEQLARLLGQVAGVIVLFVCIGWFVSRRKRRSTGD